MVIFSFIMAGIGFYSLGMGIFLKLYLDWVREDLLFILDPYEHTRRESAMLAAIFWFVIPMTAGIVATVISRKNHQKHLEKIAEDERVQKLLEREGVL
jgi:hypothetical protein